MEAFFEGLWEIVRAIGTVLGAINPMFAAGFITAALLAWGIKKITD